MPDVPAARRRLLPFIRARSGALCAIAIAACSAGLAACGGSAKPIPRVRLQLDLPADGTRVLDGSVTLRGSVVPAGAAVLVLGRSVPVTAGAFSAQVPLRPGTNIVDVLAGALHALPAMQVIRVDREIAVTVPDLSGQSPADAVAQLRALGLSAQVRDDSGPFGFLIPVSPQVCSTHPSAGQTVPPGGEVSVVVSKSC